MDMRVKEKKSGGNTPPLSFLEVRAALRSLGELSFERMFHKDHADLKHVQFP